MEVSKLQEITIKMREVELSLNDMANKQFDAGVLFHLFIFIRHEGTFLARQEIKLETERVVTGG